MKKAFEEKISRRNNAETSVFCIEMERGGEIPGLTPHYHNYIEILYAEDCSLSVWINDEELSFSTGELIIINSREAHEVYAKEKNRGKYLVIKFSPEILRFSGDTSYDTKFLLPLFRDDLSEIRKLSADDVFCFGIKNTIDDIFSEWKRDDFGCELALRGEILSLFSKIARVWKKNDGEKLFSTLDEAAKTIYAACEYCTENFASVCEEAVAERFAMSYSYFSRSFKRVMKKSFTSYINDLKIDFARNLLLTTNLSVTDIAQDAGFSTASHFIASFRNRTGFSPLAYRKKYVFEKQRT